MSIVEGNTSPNRTRSPSPAFSLFSTGNGNNPSVSLRNPVVSRRVKIKSAIREKNTRVKYELGKGVEEPKVILQKGFWAWSFGKYLIHIFALIATWIVVSFNLSNRHVWDQGRLPILTDDEATNALQFVAKLHEIIIVGSLSSIILHHVRRRLLGLKGIPLGLLSSGYQVGSAEYLCDKSFWSSFRDNKTLTLILATSIVYSNMVGPSSAVALIPSLNWFSVAVPSRGQAKLYLGGSFDEVYPRNMGPPDVGFAGCNNRSYSYRCPGAGFTSIYNWVDTWYNEGVEGNITMVEKFTSTTRTLSASTNSGGALVTTLTHPVMELTGRFWNYIQAMRIGYQEEESVHLGKISNVERPLFVSNDTAPIYGPVVQVQCSVFNYTDAILKNAGSFSTPITFPVNELFEYSGNRTQADLLAVDPSLWNFTRPMNATNLTWVDVAGYRDDEGVLASLAALVTLPDVAYESNVPISWLLPCVVGTRWGAASVQYDPTNNNSIDYNISDPGVLNLFYGSNGTDLRQRWGLSDLISISPIWAEMLNIPNVTGTHTDTHNTSSLQSLFDRFLVTPTDDDSPTMFDNPDCRETGTAYTHAYGSGCEDALARTVGTILSMVVADGLSRQAYSFRLSNAAYPEVPSVSINYSLGPILGAKPP